MVVIRGRRKWKSSFFFFDCTKIIYFLNIKFFMNCGGNERFVGLNIGVKCFINIWVF